MVWEELAILGRGPHTCWYAAYLVLSLLCVRGQCHQHPLLRDLRDTDGAAELVWHPPVVPLTVPPCYLAGGHPQGEKGRAGWAGSLGGFYLAPALSKRPG